MKTTIAKLFKPHPPEIFAHDLTKGFLTITGDDPEQLESAAGVLDEAAEAAPARFDGNNFVVHKARTFGSRWVKSSAPTVADGTHIWPLSKSNGTSHLKMMQELSAAHPLLTVTLHHRADVRTDRCEGVAGVLTEIDHGGGRWIWAEFKGKIVHPEVLRQDAGIIVSFKPMRDGSCKSTVIQEAD